MKVEELYALLARKDRADAKASDVLRASEARFTKLQIDIDQVRRLLDERLGRHQESTAGQAAQTQQVLGGWLKHHRACVDEEVSLVHRSEERLEERIATLADEMRDTKRTVGDDLRNQHLDIEGVLAAVKAGFTQELQKMQLVADKHSGDFEALQQSLAVQFNLQHQGFDERLDATRHGLQEDLQSQHTRIVDLERETQSVLAEEQHRRIKVEEEMATQRNLQLEAKRQLEENLKASELAQDSRIIFLEKQLSDLRSAADDRADIVERRLGTLEQDCRTQERHQVEKAEEFRLQVQEALEGLKNIKAELESAEIRARRSREADVVSTDLGRTSRSWSLRDSCVLLH